MARSTLCMACNPPTEWSTEDEYKAHLLNDHGANNIGEAMAKEKTKKVNTPNSVLPPGITAKDLPDPEFLATIKRIEGSPTPSPSNSVPPVYVPPIPPVKKAEEIKLEYLYKGSCPDCLTPIDTIALENPDDDSSMYVTAWCNSCKKKLSQNKVIPIGKMFPQNAILSKKEKDGTSSNKTRLSVSKSLRRMPQTKKVVIPDNT